MKNKVTPRDHELVMDDNDLILTKTDPSGCISYANLTFIKFAGYTEDELLGEQHSLVRHPDMPRVIFRILWDTIKAKKEVFAYVKNLAKDGSYYWTFASVAPDFDDENNIIGYFSVRRKPKRVALKKIEEIYKELLDAERNETRRDSVDASMKVLNGYLNSRKLIYDEFIHQI